MNNKSTVIAVLIALVLVSCSVTGVLVLTSNTSNNNNDATTAPTDSALRHCDANGIFLVDDGTAANMIIDNDATRGSATDSALYRYDFWFYGADSDSTVTLLVDDATFAIGKLPIRLTLIMPEDTTVSSSFSVLSNECARVADVELYSAKNGAAATLLVDDATFAIGKLPIRLTLIMPDDTTVSSSFSVLSTRYADAVSSKVTDSLLVDRWLIVVTPANLAKVSFAAATYSLLSEGRTYISLDKAPKFMAYSYMSNGKTYEYADAMEIARASSDGAALKILAQDSDSSIVVKVVAEKTGVYQLEQPKLLTGKWDFCYIDANQFSVKQYMGDSVSFWFMMGPLATEMAQYYGVYIFVSADSSIPASVIFVGNGVVLAGDAFSQSINAQWYGIPVLV